MHTFGIWCGAPTKAPHASWGASAGATRPRPPGPLGLAVPGSAAGPAARAVRERLAHCVMYAQVRSKGKNRIRFIQASHLTESDLTAGGSKEFTPGTHG